MGFFVSALTRRVFALVLALCLVWMFGSFDPALAHADELSDLKALVEQTAAEYEEALGRVEDLERRIGQNQDEIARIEARLPGMRESAAQAARTLYKMHRDGSFAFDLLLSSSNVSELIAALGYLDAVNSHNMAAINGLSAAKAELGWRQDDLAKDLEAAEEEAKRADAALKDAQAARQKAEDEAVERARRQVEEEAAAFAEAERRARREGPSDGVDSGNAQLVTSEGGGVQQLSGGVSDGDVDWSSDRQSFVSEWTARIDAYLSGSPLAGQGSVFASAAWDHGVDPRWSPAISCVESTKGAYCFLPCNAWGWGDYGFGSWEEAIRGHVAYLAGMYGSTVTPEAASVYCPPNASFWYNRCVEEMSLI